MRSRRRSRERGMAKGTKKKNLPRSVKADLRAAKTAWKLSGIFHLTGATADAVAAPERNWSFTRHLLQPYSVEQGCHVAVRAK